MKLAGIRRMMNSVINPQSSATKSNSRRTPSSGASCNQSVSKPNPTTMPTATIPARQSCKFTAACSSPRFSAGKRSCSHALSGVRNTAPDIARNASSPRNTQLSGGTNASATLVRLIATPATGTQPSSIRRRSRNEASPKPATIPSEAAAMKTDASVPYPP